jgi:hypothetical protein
VEASGARQVHMGCNLGSTPLALHLTYLNPAGSPLSVPAAPPAVDPDRRT